MLIQINEISKNLIKNWNEVKEQLLSVNFLLEYRFDKIDLNFEDLNLKILTILELCQSLNNEQENNKFLISSEELQKLKQNLNNLDQRFQKLKSIKTNILSFGGLNAYDSKEMIIHTKSGNPISISNYIIQISSSLNEILNSISLIAPFIKISNGINLTNKLKELDDYTVEVLKTKDIILKNHESLIELLNTSTENVEKIKNLYKNSKEDFKKIINEISEQKNEIIKNSGEVKIILEQIKENVSKANSLNLSVEEYSEKFNKYSKEINERIIQATEISERHKKFDITLSEEFEKVKNLTNKSNELLAGATKIGLSESFSKKEDIYRKETKFALWSFIGSIFFLFISTVPLILYVLKINLTNLGVNDESVVSIGGILARFLLLIPATWLSTFNSKRYNELFLLRENYSHKATIAQSIHGFKLESPKYQEEITAGVFLELNEKPNLSNSKIENAEKSPNRIISILLEKMESVFKSDKK